MEWQKTYPSLTTVMDASFETISTWLDALPKPQTDVERTVWKRLNLRYEELGAVKVRENAPHIADAMNEIAETMERLGMGRHFTKM